jgi:2-polyprenyl-3-methyl-5-hydroxy-6-metoxy-1,4-benzoquinol methylase
VTNATDETAADYRYGDPAGAHTSDYLWMLVARELQRRAILRAFEIGSGNGAFARYLAGLGIEVTGIDPSTQGVAIANQANPKLRIEIGSAYDDLRGKFGQFAAVISLEVVEHLYSPRRFASCIANLLEPGGVALITTPYHGYWKNLALALAGKMDSHFTALWDHGHIKFWSPRTLSILLAEHGLLVDDILRLGRVPPLAKSMLVVATKKSVSRSS